MAESEEQTVIAEPEAAGAAHVDPLLVAAWLWVAVPLAYGVAELINTARQLFAG